MIGLLIWTLLLPTDPCEAEWPAGEGLAARIDTSPEAFEAHLKSEMPTILPLDLARLHYRAAHRLRWDAQHERAVLFLERAAHTLANTCGDATRVRRTIDFQMAEAWRDVFRTDKAGPLYEKLLTYPGLTLEERISHQSALGDIRRHEKRFIEAGVLQREALRLSEERWGPHDPETAWAVARLALVLDNQGGSDVEAEALYRRALMIRESRLPENDPQRGRSLTNLASFLNERGRPQDALPFVERTVAQWKAYFGEENPTLLDPLGTLTRTYWLLGRYADAARNLRYELKILEASRPDQPLEHQKRLVSLFLAELQNRSFEQADTVLSRLRQVESQAPGAVARSVDLRPLLDRARQDVHAAAVDLQLDRAWVAEVSELFKASWRQGVWVLKLAVEPTANDLVLSKEDTRQTAAQFFRAPLEVVEVVTIDGLPAAWVVGRNAAANGEMQPMVAILIPRPRAQISLVLEATHPGEEAATALRMMQAIYSVTRVRGGLR